ncbi:hypothetical protein PQX77_002712 [Marasmius sp. AFHP31]|nr:hypothetical protein PQX77_002712 [Marasmius sp. AFHP31]
MARRDVPEQVSQPIVFSKLTNTIIAVANNAWRSYCSSLSDPKLLQNRLTRFTLTGPSRYIRLDWNGDACYPWALQALSIFRARGIDLRDDLSVYELVYNSAWLKSSLRPEYSEVQREQQSQQLIYLFVHQPPSDLSDCETSSLHYWSFDRDGRSPLTHETCRSLDLPIELDFKPRGSRSFSWSNNTYKHFHQYQLTRGFDPSSTDFARQLGCDRSIFRPADDSDWFEIQEESPPESRAARRTK